MRLMIQCCVIALLCVSSFFASRRYAQVNRDRELARVRKLSRKKLEDQLRIELDGQRSRHAKELAEWTRKVETETANYEKVKDRQEKHKVIYNVHGDFLVPLKALSLLKGVSFNLRSTPQGREYRPNPTIRDSLELTNSEMKGMTELLKTTWKELTEAEAEHITVKEDGHKLTVQVEPYYDEGQKVRERFFSQLQLLVGDERLDVFNSLGPKDRLVNQHFMEFGRYPYRIKFSQWGKKQRPEYLNEEGTWERTVWFQDLKRFEKYKPEYFKNFKP